MVYKKYQFISGDGMRENRSTVSYEIRPMVLLLRGSVPPRYTNRLFLNMWVDSIIHLKPDTVSTDQRRQLLL